MSRYARLFEVRILHDYYLNLGPVVHEALADALRSSTSRKYSIADLLSIRPAPETAMAMAGYQMLFKETASGFFVGVRTDDDSVDERPAVPLADDFKLRFYLKIRDPRFLSYTALPTTSPRFYRFGNDVANESAAELFLSRAVASFEADRAYEADELYAAASGGTFDLFRAVRDTGPSASPTDADWEQFPADTLDPGESYSIGDIVLSDNQLLRALVDDPGIDMANWELVRLLPNQYVTGDDSLLLKPDRFEMDISGLTLPRATLRIFEAGESTASLERPYTASAGNLSVLGVDLRTLGAGHYELELLDDSLAVLPDESFEFYLDTAAHHEGCFGVIEIEAGSGDSALLDGTQALRSPVYNIRFLNRASRWRYIFPEEQPVGTGTEVSPEAGDSHVLVTAEPRPLTYFGQGARLQADLPGPPSVSEELILPRPEIKRIRYENSQWFSEVYMSNLPL